MGVRNWELEIRDSTNPNQVGNSTAEQLRWLLVVQMKNRLRFIQKRIRLIRISDQPNSYLNFGPFGERITRLTRLCCD
ncbi:MAG: hypothetical protein LBT09_02280 [Planctomycetaceae bacterium]|nr:hypothetical protein [Planctomycetaceae bacterium]